MNTSHGQPMRPVTPEAVEILWAWATGVANLLGYPAPTAIGASQTPQILGHHKDDRIVGFFHDGRRPGFVCIFPVSCRKGLRYFDLADPNSIETAAAFIRSTFTKAQHGRNLRRSKAGASNAL